MRYPSTVGRILTLMAILALVGMALVGCPEEPPEETTLIRPAEPQDIEPEDTSVEEPPEGEAVQVVLTDYEIDMPETLPPGATTFDVTNEGDVVHNIEIEGQGIERELEENLEPGETGSLTVDLEAGEYEVYCPVGDHAEMGMRMTLTVEE